MLEYLSEEWIQQADAALRASGLRAVDGERFAVEQRVGEVVFHMVFNGDGASVRSGPAAEPAVVFSQEKDIAVAIATGALSAEEAVLDGEVVFEGDPMALLSHRRLVSRAEDVFADLRARTDWSGSLPI
ncbi:MAG: SCP2 sterol-binding domain-containing protein [bacterium]|nr:SCP2 sterol-binding domain-containing protein [bacterium]